MGTTLSDDSPHVLLDNYEISILWNYRTNLSKESFSCYRLTRIAEKKRWNPYADIEWVASDAIKSFPCAKAADPFCGFDSYDNLPRTERLLICWKRHGMEVSEILHGEQLALLCASQLISMMPCMESRLFASTQAADEARHLEFFRRYMASLGMEVIPPSPCLRQLTAQALESPRWEIKLLICQILIESLALAQFSYLIETHCVPSLQSGLRRIMDDEARHVKFGTDYLKSLFRDRDNQQLHNYGNFIIDKAFELASSDNYCITIAQQYQWDTHKLRQHLRQQRIARPELFHRRFRQLSLNIKATGLMSSSVEQRLQRFDGTRPERYQYPHS